MKKIWAFLKKYKKTCIALVIIVIAGVWYYRSTHVVTATTYIAKPATIGTVETTVSGTGQVSSSQQLTVYPQVSGTVLTVNVKDGDTVTKGQVLATLDSTNAYYSLENAKIALEKLQTSSPISNTSDENAVTNAQTSLNQNYQSAFNTISSTYNDMGPILTSLNDIFYNKNTSPYFTDTNIGQNYGSIAVGYKQTAGSLLDKATAEYTAFRQTYLATTLTSTSSISSSLNQELAMAQDLSNSVKEAAVAVNYIINQTAQSSRTSAMTTDQNELASWLSTVNTDNSSLINASTSIQSTMQTLTQAQANLAADQTTNSPLDLQSAELSLQQAQTTYDNYTVVAPFSGEIGNVTLRPGDTAGGSTAIGTIVTNQYISTIVLNEVDVAKVAVGQPVTITFNALPNLTATGTVTDVDTVGTVSQGVVSYNVQISINTTDPRIKAGMSINASVVTAQAANVVVVPNAAVKTVGGRSYVQVPAMPVATSTLASAATGTRRYGSSTGSYGSSTRNFSGTFGGGATSTGGAGGVSGTRGANYTGSYSATANTTTSSSVTVTAVTNKFVQIGLSDNTNTQIISGLNPGDLVITQTIAGTAAKAATTGSILSGLTGGRIGGGGGGGGFGGGSGATFRTTGGSGAGGTSGGGGRVGG